MRGRTGRAGLDGTRTHLAATLPLFSWAVGTTLAFFVLSVFLSDVAVVSLFRGTALLRITLEGLVASLDLERNSSTALIKPSALSWALLRSIFVSRCFSYSLKESPAIVYQSKRNKSPALPQSPPTALQASTGNGEQQADRGDERCAVTA